MNESHPAGVKIMPLNPLWTAGQEHEFQLEEIRRVKAGLKARPHPVTGEAYNFTFT